MDVLMQYFEQPLTAAELRSVARLVESGAYRPEELVHIFQQEHPPLKIKAVRVLDELARGGKVDLKPFLSKILRTWQHETDQAGIHRAVLNILCLQGVPEKEEGMVMAVCFELLANPSTPVAVVVLAIKVLSKLCQKYPEIRQELQLRIEDVTEHNKSPALRVAARDFARMEF